jgi:hypothetical protein
MIVSKSVTQLRRKAVNQPVQEPRTMTQTQKMRKKRWNPKDKGASQDSPRYLFHGNLGLFPAINCVDEAPYNANAQQK